MYSVALHASHDNPMQAHAALGAFQAEGTAAAAEDLPQDILCVRA